MPLLHKKPFVRKKPPVGITAEDKVFFCQLTSEAFSDYDEYWERLVLCNAMVWTCEVSGRPNLTFQEAVDSETKGIKIISNISPALRTALLYTANLTRRGRQNDLTEDVFNHIRDRYFPGEPVEAIVSNHWYDCKVIRVICPTPEEVAKYEKEMADSDDDIEVLDAPADPLAAVPDPLSTSTGSVDQPITLDDDDDEVKVCPSVLPKPKLHTKEQSSPNNGEYPPYATYKYEVQEELAWDYKTCKHHIVSWEQIRRSKNIITRDKCKLFLRLATELCPEGYYTVKNNIAQKYNLTTLKYKELFPSDEPKFAESKKKRPLTMSPKIKETPEKKKESKSKEVKDSPSANREGEGKKRGRPSLSEDEKLSRKLERLKKMANMTDGQADVTKTADEECLKKAEDECLKLMQLKQQHHLEQKEKMRLRLEKEKADKKQERDIKKEQRRLLAIEMREWLKPREDLTIGGHKHLPVPLPVECGIPNHLFGEFLSVLEFINNFPDVLEINDVYSHGITFEMLESAVITKEVAGVFNDVVQLLLGAVFSLQEEEDEEITADTTIDPSLFEAGERAADDNKLLAAVKAANRSSHYATHHHSTSLHQLPLDALTLTEVLRLHLLSSGADNNTNAQWRHMNRGGYKHLDDPGLQFKLNEPELVKALSEKSIFDMHIEEKLKIMQVLMQQIVTYAGVRDRIEETFDKIREVRNALREQQQSAKQLEKEEHAAKMLKKKENKQKTIEQALKKKSGVTENAGEGEEDKEADKEEEEETPEEKKEREEREEKNREKKKQEHSKKETELLEQFMNLSAKVNPISLGQDRAYRRYWIFNSLPGVFVEDDESFPGSCCEVPTAQVVDECPENSTGILSRLEREARLIVNPNSVVNEEVPKDVEEKANTSDKENDTSLLNSPKVNGVFHPSFTTENIPDNKNINKILVPPPVSTNNKKLLKAYNSPVNAAHKTSKNTQKSSKDQAITKFFSKSLKVENGSEVQVVLNRFLPDGTAVPTDSKATLQISAVQTDEVQDEQKIEQNQEVKEETEKEEMIVEELGEVFGLCSGDSETCPVHSKNTQRPKWSFFYKEESINALIDGLNDRGERESILKENLILYKSKLEQNIKSCPVYILNPGEDTEHDTAIRKSKRTTGKKGGDTDTNLNFPIGTSIDRILELTLRDMILEVEEKLFVGVLGRLSVDDREKWRSCVTGEVPLEYELDKLDYAGRGRIQKFKASLGLEVNNSDDVKVHAESDPVVRMLSVALLQVAQSIESKFLKPPMAETEKQKVKRTRAENKLKRIAEKKEKEREEQDKESGSKSDESDSDSELGDDELVKISDNSLRFPLERWECSLMTSTNFSQIFLHLATLDNSVIWSRSLTKTRCRICRKGGDHEKMLLCDGCDKGHHIFCLKPKLKSVPEGDWFCDKCKPKVKPKSPKKNRKIYVEEDDDDLEEEEEEEEDEEELQEEYEEETNEKVNSANNEDGEGYEDDYCEVCSVGGELVCCDTCPRTYHIECAGLRKIPRGTWSCPQCTGAATSSDNKSKKSKTEDAKPKKSEEKKKVAESGKDGSMTSRIKSRKRKSAPESTPSMRGKRGAASVDDDETDDLCLPVSKKRRNNEPEEAVSNGHSSRTTNRRTIVENEDLHPEALHQLISDVFIHEDAWPFLKPVNRRQVPDYYQLVKKPMDFQTMREKLNCAKYLSDAEFIADGLLVFQNCQQYNMEDTPEYAAGVSLGQYFRKRALKLGLEVEESGLPSIITNTKTGRRLAAKRKRTSL